MRIINEVTDILFKKYDSLEKLSNANADDIIKIIKPIKARIFEVL